MISEMDKLDGAILEIKSDLKAFGGSTANITPGPDGIAPLSKQNAFKKEEVIESLDLNTPEPLDVATTDEEKIPISVADPSGLEGFKMPEINFPEMEEKPVEEVPEVKDIEMPKMPDEVLGQEPQGINESIFATSTSNEPAVNTPTDVPATPTDEQPVDVPATPTDEQPVVVPTEEVSGKLSVEEEPVELPASEETPTEIVEETPELENPLVNPMLGTETKKEPESESVVPTTSVEEVAPVEETPAQEQPEEIKNENSFNREELEKYVLQLINDYTEQIKSKTVELIDNYSKELVSKIVDIPAFLNTKEEVKEVEQQPDEHVIDTSLESIPVQEAPADVDLNPISAPVEEPAVISQTTLEELPTLDSELDSMPALDAIQAQTTPTPVPAEEAPVEEQTQGGSVFPPASHDNLVEDAFNQINSMQIPGSIDNTQIQGKFL